MGALSDYARGKLGREWGRPHNLVWRRFSPLLTIATCVGSYLICLAVAGAAFFIVTSPFLGTVLRFLEPPATARTASAAEPAEAPTRP